MSSSLHSSTRSGSRPLPWLRTHVLLAGAAVGIGACGLVAIVLGLAAPAGAQPAPALARTRARLLAPDLSFFTRPQPTVAATPATPAPAPSPVAPAPPAASPAPRVAVLATAPGGNRTDLIFQPLDRADPAPAVARFAHLSGTAVLGAVVPGSTNVLVIAGTEARRDPAFGASMLVLAEGQEAKLITSGVYRGTRPLVLDDGRAFVQRGVEGAEPTEEQVEAGRMRIDHLTIEQIDLQGGASKVVSEFDGYIAFIAGALQHEIFVYRVGPEGADIIGIDADSGRERTIQRPLAPYARDFSVDAQRQALLFTNADENNPGTWIAQRLSVPPPAPAEPVVPPKSRIAVTGRVERLAAARHPSLAPTAWTDRQVAVSRDLSGLQIMRPPGPGPDKIPLDAGADIVREFFTVRQATFALAIHQVAGELPQPVVIQTKTLDVQKVPVPTGARVDVAGVLPQTDISKPVIQEIQTAPRTPVRLAPRLLHKYVAPALDVDPDSKGDEPQ